MTKKPLAPFSVFTSWAIVSAISCWDLSVAVWFSKDWVKAIASSNVTDSGMLTRVLFGVRAV